MTFPYPGNSPADLAAVAADLQASQKLLSDLSADTDDAATGLTSQWQADAATVAQKQVSDTATALTEMVARMGRARTAVDTYHDAVVTVRRRIDDLRTQYATTSGQLAGDQSSMRMNAMEYRDGDVTGTTALATSRRLSTDAGRLASLLDDLQTQYDAQVTANNTAAQACSRALTASVESFTGTAKPAGDESVNPFVALWDDTEGVRAQMDRMKAPWDVLAGDYWIGKLVEAGRLPQEFLDDLDKFGAEQWEKLFPGAKIPADEQAIAALISRWESTMDAASVFGQDFADTSKAAALLPFASTFSNVLGGLSLIGDAGVLIDPQDDGAMGWVDRGAATANGVFAGMGLAGAGAGALGMDGLAASLAVPGWGEAVAVGAGLYLGGDYLYHHWGWFHNTADSIGSTTATVAKDTWHGVQSGAKKVLGWVGL